jgi:hypothetical protein
MAYSLFHPNLTGPWFRPIEIFGFINAPASKLKQRSIEAMAGI